MFKRLWDEDGWGRVWTGLAMAIALAGGGLVYQQVTQNAGACDLPDYPDASCTGYPVGQSFTTQGGLTISTNGAVYDGYHFTGSVTVNATNVTIRNSWIENDGLYAIEVNNGASATVEDTEIECGDFSGTKGVLLNFSVVSGTFRRVNIHGCEDGLYVTDDLTLEDSYIHNLATGGPNPDPHNDGIQADGASNLSIVHNTIEAVDTAALNLNNDAGETEPIANSLVQDNLLSGGAWTLYCPIDATTNFVITGNHWLNNTWAFGPNTDCSGETDGGGNVIHENGNPVSLNT